MGKGRTKQPDGIASANGKATAADVPTPSIDGVPDPPGWLSGRALVHYYHAAESLRECTWLKTIDTAALVQYAVATADIEWAHQAVAEEGRTVETSNGIRRHPAMQILTDATTRQEKAADVLGMTPRARVRLKGMAVDTASDDINVDDPFEV